jgi:hypothetical protein
MLPRCDACLKWNMKAHAKTKKIKSPPLSPEMEIKGPMDRFQIDIGHMNIGTQARQFYFQVCVDIHTRRVFVQLLRLRSECGPAFEALLTRLRVQKPHLRLKVLEGDGEYSSGFF